MLGRLALAPENPEWWETTITLGGRPVRIGVGGGREPDPTLLARAREIVRDFESLERRLAAFLAQEAREHSYLQAWSEEIAALRVEAVHCSGQIDPPTSSSSSRGHPRTAAGVRASRATHSGA